MEPGSVKIRGQRGAILIPRVPVCRSGVRLKLEEVSKRSLTSSSKIAAIRLAISMIDLTTLEGTDSNKNINQLCQKAREPMSLIDFDQLALTKAISAPPHVAAVCVYPNFIGFAKESLSGSGIRVASVVGAFPAGQIPLDLRLKELDFAISCGADEIDMVISRGLFLSGRYQDVFDEVVEFKRRCGDQAHLKVIIEVGELQTLENVRLASWIAMEAGADFIKTSTGKVSPASTLETCLVMLYAIQDFFDQSGVRIGMKPAGGIKTTEQALSYLILLKETLGASWLEPHLFRFGASSLLGDLTLEWVKHCSRYKA